MTRARRSSICALALCAGLLGLMTERIARAQPTAPPKVGLPANQVPESLQGIGIEQRLGEAIPPGVELMDSTGRSITFGERLTGRPVLLVPVYYDCPMLCGLVLEALTKALRTLSLEMGRDFDVIVFSFDSTETYEQAAEARQRTLKYFDSEAGWSFLVGEEDSIRQLTDAIGYTAKRDPNSSEIAHAAGIFVLTPTGDIARVFFGLNYPPRDLRLALVEAGEGTIGGFVDQVLLFCFRYDPATGRYSTAILRIVRTAGVLTAVAIVAFIILARRRERTDALATTVGRAQGTT